MQELRGWGRERTAIAQVAHPRDLESVAEQVVLAGRGGIIARGCGSSYGDAALRSWGTVIDMQGLDRILALDGETGVIEVEAGVTLATLSVVAQRYGYTMPVVPGTSRVTVGGAIAADVHGKNHVSEGSFGWHVLWLDLILADGTVRRLSPWETPAQFWATVGGMGLTGVIARAALSLRAVASRRALRMQTRARNLDELLDLMSVCADRQAQDHDLHVVAWIHGTGERIGRGVMETVRLRRGLEEHVPLRNPPRDSAQMRLPGKGLVSPLTIRAANELRWRTAGRGNRWHATSLARALHPLDQAGSWPALFGWEGLLQYQFLIPLGAEDVLGDVLARSARYWPALISLKRMGPADLAPLSFPMPGWALALDFSAGRPGLAAFLARLDEIVVRAGGRVYLAKDSRLSAEAFAAMYPGLAHWREVRNAMDPSGLFVSDLAARLHLV